MSRHPANPRLPLYVAVHEAGHAVASWALQKELKRNWQQFERIVVRTRPELDAGFFTDRRGRQSDIVGIVECSDRYSSFGKEYVASLPDDIRGVMRQNMEADVCDSLAGPIAEARFRRIARAAAFISGGDEDYKIAKEKAADWSSNDNDLQHILTRQERRAAKLVGLHWKSIIALAVALYDLGNIQALAAVTIIEGAK